MDDIYRVNGYSDKELYDILDLVNPSDRELEAKILHMIWRYDNMGNSQHLSTFFRDIYDHFFEDQGQGQGQGTTEGFTMDDVQKVIGSGTSTTAATGSNINNTIPTTALDENGQPKADKEKKDDKAVLGYSFPLDYTKDSLNPLLKQTTKRIVSIDSQYRDSKKYPLSSQYTFNLSNPLKDVVNLRLYSIQIPYTWYTINDSYGSNFFYLKGNSPGIDDGLHDIKVEIGIGNYTASDLITTINNSILAIKTDTQYNDISFGDTKITYNSANSLATIDTKLKKRYDESFYSMEFSKWTTPRSNIDASGIDLTQRGLSIPAFLGFDLKKYNAYGLLSSVDSLPYPIPGSDDNSSIYKLDASNNFITIIHYLPNNGDTSIEYITNKSQCAELERITIQLTLDYTSWSKKRITDDLNSQLVLHPQLLNSSINRFQSPPTSFVGKLQQSYYLLNVRLNRMNTKNVPNSKVAIIFNESTASGNNIWTGNNSVFEFENKENELNTIISKQKTVQRQINITSSPEMRFKCITPYFNGLDLNGTPIPSVSLSLNDFKIVIPNDTYTLNGYIGKINQLLYNSGFALDNQTTCGIKINELSLMELKMDINRSFKTENFLLDLSGTFLSNSLGLENTQVILSTGGNVLYGTFPIVGAGYTVNTDYLMKLTPKIGMPNEYVPAYNVPPETAGKTYANITELAIGLNNSFAIFQDTLNPNNLLSGTKVEITQTGNQATIKLTVNIHKILPETSYKVSFIDVSANPLWPLDDITNDKTNSWAYNLKIEDSSFNWLSYNVANQSYSQYTSKIQIIPDTILLNDTNNKITFDTVTSYDGGDGIYTDTSANSVVVELPKILYSRDELFTAINTQLNANSITRGSKFSGITIGNTDYTKIRFNINKIYDASDYRVVFYDPLSFAKCNAGSSSVRNTTWDSTLGWTIGFRNSTEYDLSESATLVTKTDAHQTYYKTKTITGDTAVSVSIYNYFMIVLDDYNQSHMNAGVVTTTQSETDIPLPAYTNRALIRCDPITKLPITDITSNTGANLTKNQIIAQQVISDEKAALKKTKQYAKGPFTKDVFALVPLKLAGLPNNSVYVESGGTLQDQERTYFGPVNISRMTVKLVNDRGEIVNLNGANWSFSFICEQLYKK